MALAFGPLGCFGGSEDSRLARLEAAGLGLEALIRDASEWVAEERNRHRPLARELTGPERARLAPYFEDELLDSVRVRVVRRLENPGFFAKFEAAGEPLPMDFRQASGLALGDTILMVESRVSPGLLFHEMVHVAQDDFLGFDAYMEAYVRGWAAQGFEYRSIPQEAQAYELAAPTERTYDCLRPASTSLVLLFDLRFPASFGRTFFGPIQACRMIAEQPGDAPFAAAGLRRASSQDSEARWPDPPAATSCWTDPPYSPRI